MRRWLSTAALVGAVFAAGGFVGGVGAQGIGIENTRECQPPTQEDIDAGRGDRFGPNTEACICSEVRALLSIPINFEADKKTPVDRDGDGEIPVEVEGRWYGTIASLDAEGNPGTDGDLMLVSNRSYDFDCSVSYFREDLRRAWQFAAILAGTFLFAGMAWTGVVYMQESASGSDLSRTRAMMFRMIIGLIIVASAYVIWEAVGENLLGHLQTWTGERDVFYTGGEIVQPGE